MKQTTADTTSVNSAIDVMSAPCDLNRDLKNDPEMTLIAKVVLHIKNNPQATYNDIALVMGKSQATAKRFIEKLRLDGIIEHIGPRRGRILENHSEI